MTNVVPLPRAGAAQPAPFDAPAPPPPEEPQDDGRHGGGGKGGARGAGPAFGPVVPLGTTSQRGVTAYVFLDAAGLHSTLSAGQIRGGAWLSGLFGGQRATLEALWPRRAPVRDKDGKVKLDSTGEPIWQTVGFDPIAAGDALIAACVKQGHAAAVELRRDGLWLHSDGSLVMHCGRRVYAQDAEHRPGYRDGSAIYISAEERPDPAIDEATAQEGQDLEEALGVWHYVVPEAGPAVLLGLVACGIYGAALPWRPHVFVRGPEGSGKSSLNRLIAAACGAGEASTDTSEPGLRRQADGRSGLLPLDEKEANAAGVARVVDLMRGASDGRGAIVVRASAEGGGNDVFRVAGCFLLTAITQPKLTAADISRISLIELRALDVDSSAAVAAATQWAEVMHPRILTRLIKRWPQWRENWKVARQAALAMDATSRNADQLGALLAGWRVLVQDTPLTEAEAAAHMARLAQFLTTRAEAVEIGTPQRVLQHFLASRVPVGVRAGDLMTVQNALQETWRAFHAYAEAVRSTPSDPVVADLRKAAEEWRRKLGALGMRLMAGPERDAWPGRGPPTPGVWVGNGSPQVEHVFAGSEWAGGAWEGPLRDLPGAQKSRTSMKFSGGGQRHAVLLPLGCLGLEDEPA
jgi:predicted kinase